VLVTDVPSAAEGVAAVPDRPRDVAEAFGLDPIVPVRSVPGRTDDEVGREVEALAHQVGFDVQNGAADRVQREDLVVRRVLGPMVYVDYRVGRRSHVQLSGAKIPHFFGVWSRACVRWVRCGKGPRVQVVVVHARVLAARGDEADGQRLLAQHGRVGRYGLQATLAVLDHHGCDVIVGPDDVAVVPEDVLLAAESAQHQHVARQRHLFASCGLEVSVVSISWLLFVLCGLIEQDLNLGEWMFAQNVNVFLILGC